MERIFDESESVLRIRAAYLKGTIYWDVKRCTPVPCLDTPPALTRILMGQTGLQHHHPLPNSDSCSLLVAELCSWPSVVHHPCPLARRTDSLGKTGKNQKQRLLLSYVVWRSFGLRSFGLRSFVLRSFVLRLGDRLTC
jgi:hypothetical protein